MIKVTNLAASGAGSLRACIEASGPRVCVFEVSGVINWAADVDLYNPNITIAGQTAPSPGIMIRGGAINVLTQDVLLQHLTFRAGDDLAGPNPDSRDAMKLNYWSGTATNVVIDHCTFSWSLDESVDVWTGFKDVTVSNSIIAEGLNFSPLKNNGGFGMLTGPEANARLSLISNLFAHNVERNPLALTGQFVFANNVVYNWAKDATRFTNQPNPRLGGDLVRTKNSVVGNLYVRGPSYRAISGAQTRPIWFDGAMAGSGNQAYFSGNAEIASASGTPVPAADQWTLVNVSSPNSRSTLEVTSAPTWPVGFTARSVSQVKDHVVANAGARPGDRSAKDAEIVSDLRNGTGTWVNCVNSSAYYTDPAYIDANVALCDQRNAGGWPVYARNTRTLTIPATPNQDDDGDGYTNLEEWLHGMAAIVEGRTGQATPQPPQNVAVN